MFYDFIAINMRNFNSTVMSTCAGFVKTTSHYLIAN